MALARVAGDAKQLEVSPVIRATEGKRHNVVNGQLLGFCAALRATPFLKGPKFGDIGLSERAAIAPLMGAPTLFLDSKPLSHPILFGVFATIFIHILSMLIAPALLGFERHSWPPRSIGALLLGQFCEVLGIVPSLGIGLARCAPSISGPAFG